MNDAVLAIAAEATIEPMLQRLAHAARGLVDAAYAAHRRPRRRGRLRPVHHLGHERRAHRGDGAAAAHSTGSSARCSTSPVPYRTSDVRRDPRFRGWWPSAHPEMRSFLGVPIVAASGIVGAIYLTDKVGAEDVRRGRPAAHRDARGPRRARHREGQPLRAQPRAEHRRGAQPPGARAARLRHAEALRPHADGRGRRHRHRPRPRRGQGAAAAPAAAHARGDGRAALADLRAAPAGGRERGPRRRRCASTSTCCRACTATPSR